MDLEAELEQFHGTTYYYENFTGLLYTDGVEYLAERAGGYWLIDLVGSYQPHLHNIPFQVWRVDVREDRSALVTMVEDTGQPCVAALVQVEETGPGARTNSSLSPDVP
jgi:hypothetical protein